MAVFFQPRTGLSGILTNHFYYQSDNTLKHNQEAKISEKFEPRLGGREVLRNPHTDTVPV
jgi:hypothetical protein